MTYVTELVTYVTELVMYVTELVTYVTELVTYVTELVHIILKHRPFQYRDKGDTSSGLSSCTKWKTRCQGASNSGNF